MSLRALEAYEDGEMPKSKWTKKAMLGAIYDIVEDENNPEEFCHWINKNMKKDEIFSRFFHYSSWHHTSKYFNATDFYAVDDDSTLAMYDIWNLDNDNLKKLQNMAQTVLDIDKQIDALEDEKDDITQEIGISNYSEDYINNAQIFCDDVKKSGILTTKSDMTVSVWLEANPKYREGFGERNGWFSREYENKNQQFTVGFAPDIWYKAAYTVRGEQHIADLQTWIRNDVDKRMERISRHKNIKEKVNANYRGINDIREQIYARHQEKRQAIDNLNQKYRTLVDRELHVRELIAVITKQEKWETK